LDERKTFSQKNFSQKNFFSEKLFSEKLFLRLQSCLWMRENKILFLENKKLNLISQHRKQIANSNFLCRSTNYSSFCLMCSPLKLFTTEPDFSENI